MIPLEIKNIIFDLGGVLLDLDFEAPFREFQKFNHAGQLSDLLKFVGAPAFIKFETGDISPLQFREEIRKKLANPDISDKEIDAAWCSMLLHVPAQKVELLQMLARQYRLFLYSNTNALHLPYFIKSFYAYHNIDWETLFEKSFYSHEIKDRKPLHSGYMKVLSMANVRPEETLFVDDFKQNTTAAAELGLQVLHYIPNNNLKEDLERAGIRIFN